jgi:hypothetical protein
MTHDSGHARHSLLGPPTLCSASARLHSIHSVDAFLSSQRSGAGVSGAEWMPCYIAPRVKEAARNCNYQAEFNALRPMNSHEQPPTHVQPARDSPVLPRCQPLTLCHVCCQLLTLCCQPGCKTAASSAASCSPACQSTLRWPMCAIDGRHNVRYRWPSCTPCASCIATTAAIAPSRRDGPFILAPATSCSQSSHTAKSSREVGLHSP